jgi:hypothetical protein
MARVPLNRDRLARIVISWGIVAAGMAIAFVVSYEVLPRFRQRAIAVLYPGEQFATELSRRYRAATGRPLTYVISEMWDGGNVAHYAPERPRNLIDGNPARAPWIDLADLKRKGALVVWTEGDTRAIPQYLRAASQGAQVQEPFRLPFHRGNNVLNIGWAILPAD